MIVINIHTFQLQYFDSILIRMVFAPITKGMVVRQTRICVEACRNMFDKVESMVDKDGTYGQPQR